MSATTDWLRFAGACEGCGGREVTVTLPSKRAGEMHEPKRVRCDECDSIVVATADGDVSGTGGVEA